MPDSATTCESIAELIIVVGAGISAIAAAISAWQSREASVQARRSLEASLMNESLRSYGSPEFHDAMAVIERWCTARADFADHFRELWFSDRTRVEPVDRARRLIAHYFRQMHALWKAGAFSNASISEVITKEKVEFLRRCVEPLDLAIDASQSRSVFTDFGALHSVSPYDAKVIVERPREKSSA